MKLETYLRKYRREHPKEWAKTKKWWRFKMVDDEVNFINFIVDNVNPRLKKYARNEEWIIRGSAIEQELERLLVKVRRITQREMRIKN